MQYEQAKTLCQSTGYIDSDTEPYLDNLFFVLMHCRRPLHQCMQHTHSVGLDHLFSHLAIQLLACFPELVGAQPSHSLLHDEVRNRVHREARKLALEIRCPEDGEDGRGRTVDERLKKV